MKLTATFWVAGLFSSWKAADNAVVTLNNGENNSKTLVWLASMCDEAFFSLCLFVPVQNPPWLSFLVLNDRWAAPAIVRVIHTETCSERLGPKVPRLRPGGRRGHGVGP